jgi:hypothetical protein
MTAATTANDRDLRLCGARTRSGGRCGRPAGWGTDHVSVGPCKLHGGSTPTVSRGAHRQLVEAEARSDLERLGEPEPLGHPVDELLALGAEVRSFLEILRERVGGLQHLDTTDRAGIERESALVALYERGLDRAHRLLAELAKLGLAERLVRIGEREAQAFVELLDGVLADPTLGLTADQVVAFRRVVAVRARALAAGSAA